MSFKDAFNRQMDRSNAPKKARDSLGLSGMDVARIQIEARKMGVTGDIGTKEGLEKMVAASVEYRKRKDGTSSAPPVVIGNETGIPASAAPAQSLNPQVVLTPPQQVASLFAANSFAPEHTYNPLSFGSFKFMQASDSRDQGIGIAVSVANGQFCFIVHEPPNVRVRMFQATDILEVELDENDVTVTKHNTGSILGRAIVGGVLTGGIGALAGGVTGKTTGKSKVSSITLKVLVRDAHQPNWNVQFLRKGLTVAPDSMTGRPAYELANRYYGLLKIIIDNAAHTEPVLSGKGTQNAMDVLRHKLVSGEITEEEFVRKKNLIGE